MRIVINTVGRESTGIPWYFLLGFFFVLGIYVYDFSIHAAADYRDKVWKTLRDTYVRVLSGNWKKSESGTDEFNKYPHLATMSFLKPFVNSRSSNAATNTTETVSLDSEESPSVNDVEESSEDNSDIQSFHSLGDISYSGGDRLGATEAKIMKSQ